MDHGASATPCRISDGFHDFNHRERWPEAEPEGNMIYYNLASAKWCAVKPVGGLPRGKTFEADQSDDRYPLTVTSGVPERELE